jgi:hypothetical protein
MPTAPDRPDAPSSNADDRLAAARYRDALRAAPPEWTERAHAEAIARLSAAQRQRLLRELAELLPPAERVLAGPANATPVGIARLITRALRGRADVSERLFGALRRVSSGALLGGLVGGTIGGLTGAAAAAVVAPTLAEPYSAGADAASLPSDLEPPTDGDAFDLGGLLGL